MIKRSVALAILHPRRPGEVLLVQRPADDEDLPGVWGLPAASLRPAESWDDAAARAARDKLGVGIRIGPLLEEGSCRRRNYDLEMRLLRATIQNGDPAIAQPHRDVTQYQAWRWGPITDLNPAALAGSLCAQLCLDWHQRSR